MRVLLSAAELVVGDDIVGQGKVTSVVRDEAEVAVVVTGYTRFTVSADAEVWVERKGYVPQPTGMGTFG